MNSMGFKLIEIDDVGEGNIYSITPRAVGARIPGSGIIFPESTR